MSNTSIPSNVNVTSEMSTVAAILTRTAGNVTQENSTALNIGNTTIGAASGTEKDGLTKAADIINVYIHPIIVIIALINNILTMAAMMRPQIKRLSVSVYFCALAVSDSVTIVLDSLTNVLIVNFNVDITRYSDELCKQYHYWLPVFFTYSAWLVVCVAVERVIVVTNPFRAKLLCNSRNAVITVLSLFLLIFAVSWYHYPVWMLSEDNVCSFHPDYLFFNMFVSMWLTSVLYSYVPFVVLVVCNTVLFYYLAKADKTRQEMSSGENSKMADRFTKTAVSVCISYLFLTTPVSVYYLLLFANYRVTSSGMMLAGAIARGLALFNYAVNFYLYIITSKQFRQELTAMLGFTAKQESDKLKSSVVKTNQTITD